MHQGVKRQKSDEENLQAEPSLGKTVSFHLPDSEQRMPNGISTPVASTSSSPIVSVLKQSAPVVPVQQDMLVDEPADQPEEIQQQLIVPESEVLSLVHNLELRTNSFTIEQLEHLRAMLSEVVMATSF